MITIPINRLKNISTTLVGEKAKKLYKLQHKGFKTPNGIVITTKAYKDYIFQTGINTAINMELGKKSLDTMRWEELWDTALRIKNHFLNHKIPTCLSKSILNSVAVMLENPLAIRSSSIKEDAEGVSFAGLHESFTNIRGEAPLMKAIKMVWASLWSDAALLYRKELGLSVTDNAMAVIVQPMVTSDISGVAFGQNPINANLNQEIVEAVNGSCEGLVSGKVEPQKWILDKQSGKVIKFVVDKNRNKTLLNKQDLSAIHTSLRKIQNTFGWEADIEWTGKNNRLTLLQARPITTGSSNKSDKRTWYLSLKLNSESLKSLFDKVTNEIIPELDKVSRVLSKTNLGPAMSNKQLAKEIRDRKTILEKWRNIYVDDLIPFAHGVRAFGSFYNQIICPSDPYEFVQLLSSNETLAAKRNRKLQKLAHSIKNESFKTLLKSKASKEMTLEQLRTQFIHYDQGLLFFNAFKKILYENFDIVYMGKRLINHPSYLLIEIDKILRSSNLDKNNKAKQVLLEKKYIAALTKSDKFYGQDLLNIARESWRLRDDDNILLSRIESQYLRALEEGLHRLQLSNQISEIDISEDTESKIVDLLLNPNKKYSVIKNKKEVKQKKSIKITQRQINGQPASPGLASGKACIIEKIEDLTKFENGNILVCDAIEPQMTYLVCRAAGVIERRGGMLIHGAIIARELGIPCVNGVIDLDVYNGDFLTVDGYLGIITVGQSHLDRFE